MAVAPLLASCDFFSLDDDGPSQSGFVVTNCDRELFANTAKAYVGFAAYGGKWVMNQFSGGEWIEPGRTSGESGYWYSVPMTVEQNETGKARGVVFAIKDTEGDGYVQIAIRQYATRGDGSMGNSPCVKQIKGSDGSEIKLEYDALRRPTYVNISNAAAVLRDINIRYNADTTIVVGKMMAKHNIGYMPDTALVSFTDTVKCIMNSDYGLTSVQFEEHTRKGSEGFSMLFNAKQKFDIDSVRVADSLKFVKMPVGEKATTYAMSLEYSNNDNRCQSVDANQLLLGIDNCNPYALLGLYRVTRSGKIVSKAKIDNNTIVNVSSTHNADGSVKELTVGDVVYTFQY